MPHSSLRRLERAGDAELVQLSRKGDTDAYATLFRRHASAAASVARSVTSSYEPDDLVSEAYARILNALQKGNGPRDAFRPYLFTTVRNTAASWGRAGKDAIPLEPEELGELAIAEDHALATLDRSLTARAFRSLPPRWQEALWYSEVEGMQPAELAPIVGLSAQATAALCYRAREGLRQAWIRAHLTSGNLEPECAWTVEHLAANARGRLGRRDRPRLDAHLQTCEKCRMAAAEAEETGSRLALVLLPLILGAGAATAYTATLNGGVAAGASAAAAGGGASGSAAGASGSAAGAAGGAGAGAGAVGGIGAVFTGATGVIIGAAATALVVGGAVAGVLIATSPGHGSDASPAIVQDASGASGDAAGPSASSPRPAPSAPAPTPPDDTAAAAPVDVPAAAAAEGSSPASVPSIPAGPSNPGTPSEPSGPGGPGSSEPSGPSDPGEPGNPGDPADPQPPAAPTVSTVDTGDDRYYPIVSGTAEPGAIVTVVAAGHTTTVVADATGAWSASPLAERQDAAASGTITVTQTVDGLTSPEVNATYALKAPELSAESVLWDNSPVVKVSVVGGVRTGILLTVDGETSSLYVDVPDARYYLLGPGEHDIDARYTDDAGRFGPRTHVTVTVGR